MMLTSRCPRSGKRPLLWSPVGAAQLRLRLWIYWKEELESQVRGGTVGPGQLGEGTQTASSKGRPDLTKGEGTAAFEARLWQMLRIIHLELLGWNIHVVAQDRNSLAYSLIVVFMFPSHFFCRLPFSSQDKSLSSNGGPKVIQKLACLCRENHWFTARKPQMCLGMWGQNFKARQVKVFRDLGQTIDGNPFVALCCSKLATVTIWLVYIYTYVNMSEVIKPIELIPIIRSYTCILDTYLQTHQSNKSYIVTHPSKTWLISGVKVEWSRPLEPRAAKDYGEAFEEGDIIGAALRLGRWAELWGMVFFKSQSSFFC